MSWMDSWSRPNKHAATPPPLYLTVGDTVPYCHSCGRVISERKKHSGATEVKYCSARCRNNKPGPIDRRIEATFAALLNGATPESLKDGGEGEGKGHGQEKGTFRSKEEKKHKKKGSKSGKGDHRIIVECSTVEEIVFQRAPDPEKTYGRRKNRRARFVVEKPEDWRSVDMVDDPTPAPASNQATTSTTSSTTGPPPVSLPPHPNNDASSSDPASSSEDEGDDEGGIPLSPSALPDTISYGYGAGKVRPPQSESAVNGSVGGEKGWAERVPESSENLARRREGQQRAEERESVRRAGRRGCAFGFAVRGEGEGERRKCEAVMKGAVVEASFAKGEWGVRWREE